MPLFCVEAIERTGHTPRKADVIVPITPFRAASAVQGHTGDARLHWQNGPGDGGICQIDVNGPLTTGLYVTTTPIVPGNEALLGTPIATVVNLDSSGAISESRVTHPPVDNEFWSMLRVTQGNVELVWRLSSQNRALRLEIQHVVQNPQLWLNFRLKW
ncbi:hypothetical protein B0H16DRAFT_1456046 [Mycena metata]|uniref:Uncharacterized protein n=1 Tax=Mycena metata TaxID=1033252 RepID=A0AAD7NGH2_9AGAR|nr:hypothetical protein B0H16DRAFT_1456046 [Mycena metata]